MSNTVPVSPKKISALRLSRAMTRAEWGAVIGRTEAGVRRIEKKQGTARVYLKTIRGIAGLLGKTPDEVTAMLAPAAGEDVEDWREGKGARALLDRLQVVAARDGVDPLALFARLVATAEVPPHPKGATVEWPDGTKERVPLPATAPAGRARTPTATPGTPAARSRGRGRKPANERGEHAESNH